jgi:pimeloyl-ACP methyl ester carboxylesterase
MTSLGRLIFFDQPGTGASDPAPSGALPTLEQWADSITAVLDDLGSREAVLVAGVGAFATGALFAATHPSRTTALVALEVYADPMAQRTDGLVPEEVLAAMVGIWGTGEIEHVLNPDTPWNEEIRATWARLERMAASPGTAALMMPLVSEMDVRALLPAVRVPTLVVQHADDPVILPSGARTSQTVYRARSMLSCLGATYSTSLNPGASPSRRSPSSSPASRPTWPMIGFSPRCSSPTSWTRAAEIGDRDWHALLWWTRSSICLVASLQHSSARTP